ncbi:poly(rC)-binding protein 1-like [Suncus etruscus]|uniref:poly(rC)-binding protein 1-like n=1 Tax=Suncus etruscus TaxID=109475 RepID=UPI0021107A69|nr:poly(rC)-binding protein 1-like [Suncus etruscus]
MDIHVSGRGLGARISLTLRLMMRNPQLWRGFEDQEMQFVMALHEASGVQVSMSCSIRFERNLTLSGSINVVFRAVEIIIDKLQDNVLRYLPPTLGPHPTITLRLIVPHRLCYELLWNGSSMLRCICLHSGAQVHVSSNPLSRDTDLTITVVGRPYSVNNCMKQIFLTLMETLVCLPQEHGQAFLYQPRQVPVLSEGFINAMGQLSVADYTCATIGYPHAPPNATRYLYCALYLSGQSLLQMGSCQGQLSTTHFFMPIEQSIYINLQNWCRRCRREARQRRRRATYEFMIPNGLIGSMIGINGANITAVRHISGARVSISPLVEGESMRLVMITGTYSSICLAYYMLTFSLSNEMP